MQSINRSKKRRLHALAAHFPPRKKARIDYDGLHLDQLVRTKLYNSEKTSTSSTSTTQSRTKKGVASKSSSCSKYPSKTKNISNQPGLRSSLNKKSLKVQHGASPYSKLMAQGTITHILRECRAKQKSSSSLLLAKQRSDALFGAGNDELHLECTLMCSDSNKTGIQFRNSLKARPAARSPTAVGVDLELEQQLSAESCALGNPNTNEVVPENSTTAIEEGGKESVQSLSTEHSDNLADGSDGHIGIEAVPVPASTNGANYHHLPFNFMSGTSSSTSDTNCGAEHQAFANTSPVIHCWNNNFTLGQSSSPRRHLYKPANSNDILTCNYYSPIRPRASRGPKMARIETPLSHASFSFAERMQQQSRTPPPLLAPASPFSPRTPFDFMSEQQYQTEKEQLNPSQTMHHPMAARPTLTSPLHTLATIVKSIFNFFAMKVLYYKLHQRGNILSNINEGQHRNSSSWERTHASDTLPKNSPRSFMHRVPIVPSQRNSHRSFQASTLEHRRHSRYSPSQLPLPQPSNRAFLFNHNNQQSVSSSGNVRVGGSSTTAPRQNKQSRNDATIQSSSSSSHSKATPPSDGWKSLFHPKGGEWKCEFCYYVNPSEAMTCDSCTALKEPPKSILKPASYHPTRRHTDATASAAETGTGFSEADITGIEKDDGSYNDDDSYFASDDDHSSDDEGESEADDDDEEEDDGSPSKRVKVSSSIDNSQQQWQQVNVTAEVQATINQCHDGAVEEDEQRTQPTRSGSGKRIKVRYDQGPSDKVGGDAFEAMSTESTSKKRGSDNETLILSSKAAREHVECMAMDDSSLNDLSTNEMDVE